MEENCEIVYKNIEKDVSYEETIKKVVDKCFEVENMQSANLYISITLTNPEEIRKINNEFRNVDLSTDVLSFPMFEKQELEKIIDKKESEEKRQNIKDAEENMEIKNKKEISAIKSIEENCNQDILGDIIISIQKVKEQAKEYGHSFERELAYMVVHGFYHLMGYDHMNEEEKKVMRGKEENVLTILNINRI